MPEKKPDELTPEETIQRIIAASEALDPGAPAPGQKPGRALPKRRPAEFSAFVVALASLLAYLGVDQAEPILYAGLGVAGTLPFVVSWAVDQWRAIIGVTARRG